ncbi:DUF1801 domain-containing protein [Humibacter ginsengiterrae]
MAQTKKTSTKPQFTEGERAAMKEYVEELKTNAKRGGKATREDGERDIQEKIAAMSESDRAMAERVHQIITEAVPELMPKTWYGMPAYALEKDTICFFQPAGKFKARYSTLGFNDGAQLDDGQMWATSFALTELTPAVAKRIAELVRKAAG